MTTTDNQGLTAPQDGAGASGQQIVLPPQTASELSANIVMLSQPNSSAAEAYRQLRTNIMAQPGKEGKGIHSLILTSAEGKVGKSLVAANLAVAFAQAGSSVIIVDANLRQPMLHQLFGCDNSAGLSSLLLRSQPTGTMAVQKTQIPNLLFMGSGPVPERPGETLTGERLGDLIGRLREEADFLIIDTPPVGLVNDPLILAKHVDGVILTLKAGQSNRQSVKKAQISLQRAGATIIGTVFTNAPLSKEARKYFA